MPLTPPLLLPPHTEKNLKTFQQHVTGYVSALRDTCSLQTNVSGDLLYFFEAKSENRVHADGYHKMCTQLHRSRWTALAKHVAEEVLNPLEKHLSMFPIVFDLAKKRKDWLMEYLDYKKKVASLAKAGKSKLAAKLRSKSQKMDRAERLYKRVEDDILDLLDRYEHMREDLMVQYTCQIMIAQRRFFDGACGDVAPARETSALFKKNGEMKACEIESDLKKMVNDFKRGEYASASVALGVPSLGGSRSRSASPMPRSSAEQRRAEKKKRAAVGLKNWGNPAFDLNITFEERHRMWAPDLRSYRISRMRGLPAGVVCVRNGIERAVYSYEAAAPGELSFREGDEIEVLDRGGHGWWKGKLGTVEGFFPCNYTEPVISSTSVD